MTSMRRTAVRPSLLSALLLLTVLVSCQTSPGTAVNQPPTASFVATGAVGPAPLTVAFDASGSFDRDGIINAYLWNFGDGATGTGIVTQHTYTSPGGYTARLTVIDDRGASASATVEIEVGSGSGSGTGSISGRIMVGGSTPTAERQALLRHGGTPATGAGSADAWANDDGVEVVPGELIVKFTPGLRAQGVLAPMTVGGVRLEAVRALALPGTQLYRAPGLSQAATIALARQVQARPDVVYAQPNAILRPFAIPNDPGYELQWHYGAINMPAAWDITTGAADIVVAVVDTGILYRSGNASSTHPELIGKVLPGYDFMSDSTMARDSDGRDPDPFDEGFDACDKKECTELEYYSSYHGTHVAGTVAAATNNGIGVAGVDWQARILPIRVLGRGGGSMSDIIDGTLWAAGFDVLGVPPNANPAHVINLSLGGAGPCGPFEQDAFAQIASSAPRRAIVIVAAGNATAPASQFVPGNCSNVITVGATGPTGARAPYSNYGARIDVMAPGGDLQQQGGGVLSLSYDDDVGAFNLFFSQGTSMAAPHVAGVVSLMKSLQPTLGFSQALALLQATSRPLSAVQCGTGSAGDCGAGLIDAAAALAMLQSGDIPNPGGAALIISPNPLDFGRSVDELAISLTNTTASSVTWQIFDWRESAENPGILPDDALYLPVGTSQSGVVAAGSTAQTGLGIDRTKVTADGAYQLELLFDVGGGAEQSIVVRFSVGAATIAEPEGAMIVGAFIIDDDGELVLSGFQEAGSFFSAYGFEVLSGDNLVIAWSDVNANDDIDEGDFLGIYRDVVPVGAGQNVTGIDFALERVIGIGASVAPPTGLSLSLDDWERLVDRLIDRR